MREIREELNVFGSRLAESRRSCGMTQEEMANRLGVTPQAVSKWERGTSTPDLEMLYELCNLLGTSADYLLGTGGGNMTEDGDEKMQGEILKSLRDSLDPLELIFGEEIVPLFVNNEFVQHIAKLRRELAKEGILMPIVRIKDFPGLKAGEFMILAYQNVIYREVLDEVHEEKLNYIIGKLGENVRNHYDEIINADMLKVMTDNLKIKYPALIENMVPEKIPYGLLLDVTRESIRRGNSTLYLPKIIEGVEHELREYGVCDAAKLAERVCAKLERDDNFWVVMHAGTKQTEI